ncbi:MAG: RNA 2',3'-cyclic phosphodiesterase [Planctomycetota bacterium]
MKAPRLFIALQFSGGVKKNLTQLQAELRERMPTGWNWSDADMMHITLRFIGEVGPNDIVPVCDAVTAATDGIAPFEYKLEGIGVFPKPSAPRTLWAGLGGDTGPIVELNRRLEEAMLELGHRGEPKPFRPHVTLARSVRGETIDEAALNAAIAEVGSREIAKVFAREVITFNSLLTRDGAVYEVMARAPLT